jgi:hypothetical protein
MTTTEPSVTDRTLCLVSGYHTATFPPADVFVSGLRHRFAVVLDTYRRDKEDMYFDTGLFLHLVPTLCQAIGYDYVAIRMIEGGRFQSFDDLARQYSGIEELEKEPPARIDLHRSGQLVGAVETELWTMVGGPSPYHDSYTLSFYTDRDRSPELRRVSETVCSEVGAVITGYYEGQESKEPYCPWWRKVLRLFAHRYGPPRAEQARCT